MALALHSLIELSYICFVLRLDSLSLSLIIGIKNRILC